MFLNNGLDQTLIDEKNSLRAMKKALRLSDVSSESSHDGLAADVKNKLVVGHDLQNAEALMRFM